MVQRYTGIPVYCDIASGQYVPRYFLTYLRTHCNEWRHVLESQNTDFPPQNNKLIMPSQKGRSNLTIRLMYKASPPWSVSFDIQNVAAQISRYWWNWCCSKFISLISPYQWSEFSRVPDKGCINVFTHYFKPEYGFISILDRTGMFPKTCDTNLQFDSVVSLIIGQCWCLVCNKFASFPG